MVLTKFLLPDLILIKASCTSKDDLISILIDRVYSVGLKLPLKREDLIKTIQAREEMGGTLLPSGLAIPHARLNAYEDFIVAIGIPAKAIYLEDHQIQMMALMISSQTGGSRYLNTLAELSKISRREDYFASLCEAENPEAFMDLLGEWDSPE